MDADNWARTSFKISGRPSACEALCSVLGDPVDSVGADTWIWDIERSTDQSLQEQLHELECFLGTHQSALIDNRSDIAITVIIGWSPRIPQDSVALPASLVALLGGVGATVLIDTYVDEDIPRIRGTVL